MIYVYGKIFEMSFKGKTNGTQIAEREREREKEVKNEGTKESV